MAAVSKKIGVWLKTPVGFWFGENLFETAANLDFCHSPEPEPDKIQQIPESDIPDNSVHAGSVKEKLAELLVP